MAEEEKEEKKEEAPPKKKSKLVLIIGIVVVLLIVAGGAFFLLNAKKAGKDEVSSDAAITADAEIPEQKIDAEDPLEEGEESLGAILPLDPFVVNLTGGKYIRIQLQLEFVTREVPKKIFSRLPIMRDNIIASLNQQTAEKVLAESGKEVIKGAIKDIVNSVLRKEDVKKVYITQFIVQ